MGWVFGKQSPGVYLPVKIGIYIVPLILGQRILKSINIELHQMKYIFNLYLPLLSVYISKIGNNLDRCCTIYMGSENLDIL